MAKLAPAAGVATYISMEMPKHRKSPRPQGGNYRKLDEMAVHPTNCLFIALEDGDTVQKLLDRVRNVCYRVRKNSGNKKKFNVRPVQHEGIAGAGVWRNQ